MNPGLIIALALNTGALSAVNLWYQARTGQSRNPQDAPVMDSPASQGDSGYCRFASDINLIETRDRMAVRALLLLAALLMSCLFIASLAGR